MLSAGYYVVVANTWRERQQKQRETRFERYREQLASGGPIVRQMTESEGAYWNEHSTSADRKATPEELKRRDAARQKREREATRPTQPQAEAASHLR